MANEFDIIIVVGGAPGIGGCDGWRRMARRRCCLRCGRAFLTVSTAVLAGDEIRLPAGVDPWREAAAALPLGHNEKVYLEIGCDAALEPDAHAHGNLHDPRSAS